jgi:perosamine synthetase
MRTSVSRREFLTRTAAVGAGLYVGLSKAAAASPVVDKEIATPAWPVWNQQDESALGAVLNSGKWGRSVGARVKEFEAAFAGQTRARYCLATSSGTTALITTLGACGVGPGDEVILPPYTFVATFNAITAHFALPVFVDVNADTFQIDPAKIAAAISPATKVLLPVHIGGYVADLDALPRIARQHGIALIEDAAQATVAEWRGQRVGTAGTGGCFSFQATKNLTSGEGGAVTTNDEEFANRCYNFHSPSGQKPALRTGRGANFRMTEFQAGLLLVQMTRLEAQSRVRDANAAYLTNLLEKIPGVLPARLIQGCTRSGYHLYMLRYDARQFAGLPRGRLIQLLAARGVSASGGYAPLNQSPHVRALADNPHYLRVYGKDRMARWLEQIQCPVNEHLCSEALWFTHMQLLGTRADMERIAETLATIQKQAGDLAHS